MKINQQGPNELASAAASRATSVANDKTANRVSGAGGHAGDEVQLSSLGESLRALSTDTPEGAERLERLANLVQTGSYAIDERMISRSLVDEALREGGLDQEEG